MSQTRMSPQQTIATSAREDRIVRVERVEPWGLIDPTAVVRHDDGHTTTCRLSALRAAAEQDDRSIAGLRGQRVDDESRRLAAVYRGLLSQAEALAEPLLAAAERTSEVVISVHQDESSVWWVASVTYAATGRHVPRPADCGGTHAQPWTARADARAWAASGAPGHVVVER